MIGIYQPAKARGLPRRMREVLTPYGVHGQWDLQFFHGKVPKVFPAAVLVDILGKQQFSMTLWKHFKYI